MHVDRRACKEADRHSDRSHAYSETDLYFDRRNTFYERGRHSDKSHTSCEAGRYPDIYISVKQTYTVTGDIHTMK